MGLGKRQSHGSGPSAVELSAAAAAAARLATVRHRIGVRGGAAGCMREKEGRLS